MNWMWSAAAAAIVIVTADASTAAFITLQQQKISTHENERVLNKFKFDISKRKKKQLKNFFVKEWHRFCIVSTDWENS